MVQKSAGNEKLPEGAVATLTPAQLSPEAIAAMRERLEYAKVDGYAIAVDVEMLLAHVAALEERIATLETDNGLKEVAVLELSDLNAIHKARIARLQAVAVAAHDEWFASSIPSPITLQAALAALQPGDLPT